MDGIDLCNLLTSILLINVPVGLFAFARKINLVFLLILDKILSTLAVRLLSFAITPLAPAIEIAWGNCKKPYSV